MNKTTKTTKTFLSNRKVILEILSTCNDPMVSSKIVPCIDKSLLQDRNFVLKLLPFYEGVLDLVDCSMRYDVERISKCLSQIEILKQEVAEKNEKIKFLTKCVKESVALNGPISMNVAEKSRFYAPPTINKADILRGRELALRKAGASEEEIAKCLQKYEKSL